MLKLKFRDAFYLLMYALPNTALSFGIVYIINNTLAGNEAFTKDYMIIVFVSMIVYTYLLNVIFQKQLNKFAFKRLYENEKSIFGQILKAPLIKLEKMGANRFFTAVEDLRAFSFLPYTVTHTVNSLLMLALCLVYMFTVSIPAAFCIVGLIALTAGCYSVVMNSMSKEVTKLRGHNEHYYKYVDDVMKGFKELKLGFFRRENLMNRFLVPNRNEAQTLDTHINYVFLSINLISQYGLYFVIAVILFGLPAIGMLDRADVITYVVIILFVSAPINNLINLQQMYTRFIVANRRIKNFMKDFEIDGVTQGIPSQTEGDFQSLNFKNVVFSYDIEGNEKSFALGPLNLKVQRGETIFIVGGNGSGKSTFINILTGLYENSGGDILLNNQVQEKGSKCFQDHIAAVFTNNHIFSHNYEEYQLYGNERYQEMLKMMEMDHIVQEDTEEAARRGFSKGQSKRMSLIFALLEQKPILVLDEWAADQDPHFRRFFYEMLIPKFKEEGKTIIAVTHDDSYFHLADRLIKFDYGKIVKDVAVKKTFKLSENFWV